MEKIELKKVEKKENKNLRDAIICGLSVLGVVLGPITYVLLS